MSLFVVTIDPGTWGDPRVGYLARLGQYPDGIYSAVGRLGRLWARCNYLGTDVPGHVEIQACFDDRGPELLVRSGLGEQLEDGSVRVRGVASRTVLEVIRGALHTVDETFTPAQADEVYRSLVAHIRARRPECVAPLGVLGPPTETIRDPRGG